MSERKAAKGIRAVIKIREKARNDNLEFSLDQLKKLAKEEFAKAEYEKERSEGYLEYCIRVVDEAYTKKYDPSECFLPGMEFDLEGDHKIGGGKRVDKRKCLIHHERIVLENERKHWSESGKEYRRKMKLFKKLEPFWLEGMSKEDAVKAYYLSNPNEEMP